MQYMPLYKKTKSENFSMKFLKFAHLYIYIYIERERERERWVQVINCVTLINLHLHHKFLRDLMIKKHY